MEKRLADIDELRKDIVERGTQLSGCYSASTARYMDRMLAHVLDAVDHAPTIDAVPHWIPCEERLPSEEGPYIVYAPTYRGGSSTAKENHGGIMFSKWKNSKWSIEHGYYERPNCVLAWMPLPEPYEGERRDDERTVDDGRSTVRHTTHLRRG